MKINEKQEDGNYIVLIVRVHPEGKISEGMSPQLKINFFASAAPLREVIIKRKKRN